MTIESLGEYLDILNQRAASRKWEAFAGAGVDYLMREHEVSPAELAKICSAKGLIIDKQGVVRRGVGLPRYQPPQVIVSEKLFLSEHIKGHPNGGWEGPDYFGDHKAGEV